MPAIKMMPDLLSNMALPFDDTQVLANIRDVVFCEVALSCPLSPKQSQLSPNQLRTLIAIVWGRGDRKNIFKPNWGEGTQKISNSCGELIGCSRITRVPIG